VIDMGDAEHEESLTPRPSAVARALATGPSPRRQGRNEEATSATHTVSSLVNQASAS